MFKHGPALFLAALSAVLLATLGWLWFGPGRISWQPPPVVKPNLSAIAATGIDPPRLETAQAAAVTERPVFSVSRRPVAAASAAGAAKLESIDAVQIVGLMTGGAGASALIRGEDGKTRRLAVSESVGDWRLREVRGTGAIFVRGAESRTIALKPSRFAAAGGSSAGMPAATAAPGSGTGMFSQAATPFGAPAATASVPSTGTRTFPALPPPAPVAAGGASTRPLPAAPANAFIIGGQRP